MQQTHQWPADLILSIQISLQAIFIQLSSVKYFYCIGTFNFISMGRLSLEA